MKNIAKPADSAIVPGKTLSMVPVRKGYDRWAEVYDLDGNPLTALEEPVVSRLLGDVKGLQVADIGCGTGRHAVRLAKLGAAVTAVDFSPGMLAKARVKPGAEAVRFIHHDISRRLPFKSGAFDRVLCSLVLEHIKDLVPFFRELGRICGRRGYVVISAMHPALWLKGQSARFYDPETGLEVRPHSHRQQLSDYVMAASANGLDIDHMREYAPDQKLAEKFPRAAKHIGWPILVVMRLKKSWQVRD